MSSVSAAGATAARRAKGSGKRAANGRAVEVAGRVGLVAKGVSYALIAVLALQVAFGDHGDLEDRQGVLREVATASFGKLALWALAVGFACYALWQFMRAVLDRHNDGTDARGLAKRAKHGAVGAVYVGSAVAAVSLARGSSTGSGGDERAQTARVLEWPGGRWIVGVVGLALFVYGVWNAYKGWDERFRKEWDESQMSATTRTWAVRSGKAGNIARGVVFAIVGFFLAKAAYEYDPDEAVGIDGALAKLQAQSWGTWLLGAVALGLLAYAVFCLVQARWRRV